MGVFQTSWRSRAPPGAALGALSHYADETYLEILNLAQTSNASSRYDPKDNDLDWGDN